MDKKTRDKEVSYGQLAMAHAKLKRIDPKIPSILPTISPGTAEWDAWTRYFVGHLGFEPVAMKRVRLGMGQEFTVPDKLPELFDASYTPVKLLAAE